MKLVNSIQSYCSNKKAPLFNRHNPSVYAPVTLYLCTLQLAQINHKEYTLGPSFTPGGGINRPSSPMGGFHVGSIRRLVMMGDCNGNTVWPSNSSDRSKRATPYGSEHCQPQELSLSAVFSVITNHCWLKASTGLMLHQLEMCTEKCGIDKTATVLHYS